MYFQKIDAKNPIFMKEIDQNLFKQTFYLTILTKIGLLFSNYHENDVNLSIESFLDNMNSKELWEKNYGKP